MRRSKTPTLDSMTVPQRSDILATLLGRHPELAAEVEALAIDMLGSQDRHVIAGDVRDELCALTLEQLAGRAGPQWGGGYIDAYDAADEMLADVVQPYFDDLRRRAEIGAPQAAAEIAYGVLLGLYACRHKNDDDLVLTHAGLPDAVDNLAIKAITVVRRARLDLDGEWLAGECPQWSGMLLQTNRGRVVPA